MEELDPKVFGARLRAVRKARQLVQKELADAIGQEQSYISQLENGQIERPSAVMIRGLEDRLRVYRGYLTEPESVRRAREEAVDRLLRDHKDELGINDEDEVDLRYRISSPGVADLPITFWIGSLNAARALRSKGI